jgi:hypothetical protein
MEYPPEFPKRLRPHVDVEIIRKRHKLPKESQTEKRITETFAMFAEIALKAVESGEWRVDLAHSGLTHFLMELCEDDGDYMGVPFPEVDPSMERLMRKIQNSKKWLGYLEKLATLSESQAVRTRASRSQTEEFKGVESSKPKSERAEEQRKAFVDPLLDAKGWSILDWANEADVAYHTAADYLAGKKNPFRSTRVKLAKALGIPVNSLPK